MDSGLLDVVDVMMDASLPRLEGTSRVCGCAALS